MSRQDDFNEEIREHIEIETRENIARGMDVDEARRAAIHKFGNRTAIEQELREGARLAWIGTIAQDVRYGMRTLRRSWMLSIAIVITLTLGIGMNAGVFTILNGMLLRPRVEKDPARFVHVVARYGGETTRVILDGGLSTDDFRAVQARARSMENVAAWGIGRATIGRDDPTQELMLTVTCNFFSLYGLDHPMLGRLFFESECKEPGAAPVAVISEGLWRLRFHSDPAMVGSTLRLNGSAFTIVGVTPAHFAGQLRGPGIWTPWTMQPNFFGGIDLFRDTSTPWLMVEGRLRPGETRKSVATELTAIEQQQDRLQKDRRTTIYATNGSIVEEPGQGAAWLAPLVTGAMLLVLLLAATNVTTLLLSRAAARQHEISIRLSLGAGRARLLRMLLTESVMLASVGGAIAAWIAWRAPGVLEKMIPGMPHYPLQPDVTVFAYIAGITLLAGMLAGLAPARESLRADLMSGLKGQTTSAGRSSNRGWLVGSQVAMSLVLLAGAGFFVRAELTAFGGDVGFETQRVFAFALRTAAPAYTSVSAAQFDRTFAERLHGLPGIDAVAFTSSAPYSNDESGGPQTEVRLAGQEKGRGVRAAYEIVSAGFFQTLGIAIDRGRAFRESEAYAKTVVSPVVISQTLAHRLWPNREALGEIVYDHDGAAMEVVGVARDVKSQRFGVVDGPMIYLPRGSMAYGDWMLARFHGDAAEVQQEIRDLLRRMDPEMKPRIATLASTMATFAEIFWHAAETVLILGLIALLLAVVGIYGVVAFAVNRRRREIGIRMALGATRGDVLRGVMISAARPVAIGVAAGLMLAIAGGVVLGQALKFSPVALNVTDPSAYLAVSLVLLLTAGAAMLGPAMRAARSDPMKALRQE